MKLAGVGALAVVFVGDVNGDVEGAVVDLLETIPELLVLGFECRDVYEGVEQVVRVGFTGGEMGGVEVAHESAKVSFCLLWSGIIELALFGGEDFGEFAEEDFAADSEVWGRVGDEDRGRKGRV